MIKRLTVFYNPREEQHESLMARLRETGLELTALPTSGPYSLWKRGEGDSIEGVAYGPTAINYFLDTYKKTRAA